MKKRSHFFEVVARVFLLAVVLLGSGFFPVKPAMGYSEPVFDPKADYLELTAQTADKTNWAKVLAKIADIVDAVAGFFESIIDWFKKLFDTESTAAAVESAGQEAEALAIGELNQIEMDNAVQDQFLGASMRAAAKDVPPQHEHLCKSILVHQAAATTEEFERAVSRVAASAAESRYRGPKQDGSGPQYARDNYKDRCDQKLASPIDHPAECVDDSVKGTKGQKIHDADLSLCTLTGNQVLEMPKMESTSINGVTYSVPKPTTDEQKFWVAGLFYCMNLAGPRPSPPYGKELTTPEGMRKKAQWDYCAAQESAALQPCFDLLAHHTRPNPDEAKDLIKAQNVKCEAAKAANIKLPDSFADCKKGLSPQQAMYLAQSLCKSEQYYIAQAMAGERDPKMLDNIIDCSLSWNLWKETEVRMENKVSESVSGIVRIQKNCWSNVGR